jgi:CcmD family protein
MLYLFVGYFVLWSLTFGYLVFLGARQKQVRRDVARLLEEHSLSEPSEREST